MYVDADCAVKPDGQNSVISFVILKRFSLKFSRLFSLPLSLPRPPRGKGKRRLNFRLKVVQSLSFCDRWSRGTKTLRTNY